MANYVVSDTNLTLIADAIRAKSGHNELLEWPNEYKTSIDNLNPVDMCIKTATDDVVSVSDAAQYDAKNVSIKIEPMQNLHGYDHPWPAGGGVNVLDFAQYFTEGETVTQNGVTATFSNGYLKVTGTNTTSTFNIIYKACNVVLPAGTYIMPKNLNIRCNIDDQGNNNYAGAITAESSVQMVAFYVFASTGATVNYNIPMMMVKGETRPTVYSPYANICPITGWTGAKVTRTGKNLLSPHLYSGIAYNPTVGAVVTLTDNPVQFTDEGNGVFSVQTTATWRYFALIYPIDDVNLSHVYSLSWASTGQFGITRGFLDENHTVLTKFNTTDASGNWVAQFEPTATAKYLYFVFTNRGTASATLTITQPQIELGSTATDYEPYVGDTYPITFPSEAGTVYGGTLDVTEGVLTVDRVMWTKNTSTMDNGENYPGWRNAGVAAILGTGVISYITTVANIGSIIGINTNGSNDILYLGRGDYGRTETEWKALAIDVQVVLPLAAPVTYTLTPQQIALLRGNNTLWADTGNVTLKYFTTAFEDLAEEIGFADGGDY